MEINTDEFTLDLRNEKVLPEVNKINAVYWQAWDTVLLLRRTVFEDEKARVAKLVRVEELPEDIDKGKLVIAAMENTIKKNGLLFGKSIEVIKEMAVKAGILDEEDELPVLSDDFYVLTSKKGKRGATFMFSIPTMMDIADKIGTDKYLVAPMSIDQVAIFPGVDKKEIAFDMLKMANNITNGKEDILSNKIFIFNKQTMNYTLATPEEQS